MIEKCSIGNMTNNIQNITLILLILILIIVIIYYLKNSNAKHNELIEKYTTTPTNIIDRTPDIYHSGALTEANRLSHFPTQGSPITLRTCQVAFNNDKTSKYEYQDEWQEIDMLEGVEVPVKIIGRDNTTNASTISNFSEKSRCYKELSSTDTNKYKYLNNDLIQYDKNHFISLTSNINGAPVVKNYMQMKFDVFGNNVNHYDNIRDSICSLNYSTTLRSGSSDSTSTLGNTELYRLKLTENKIIEYIEKITIDPEDNHIFNKDSSFGVANLIAANTGKYKYDTSSKLFVYEPSNASASNDIRTINLYQFERNLFCDKQEIKSYKKLDNAKIDMLKFINYGIPSSTYFDKTTIPAMYMSEPKYSTYISNITKVNSKTDVDGYLNELITKELESLNTITSNTLRIKRDLNQKLIDIRTNFIEPSNNSKAKFIQNAIVKNNYDNNNTYQTLLNENNYNLDFGNVSYSGYSIVDNDASIKISEVNEPKLQEFVSATAVTDDIWEVKIFKEDGEFNLPVKTEGCEILIVGGGGGGGAGLGSGGGAGGLIYSTNLVISAGTYNISVGKGGTGAINYLARGSNGNNSSAFGIIAYGGGGGAGQSWVYNQTGAASGTLKTTSVNQGSGAGGTRYKSIGNSGTAGQGNSGGNASPDTMIAGGGGGAGSIGGTATNTSGGIGGTGLYYSITGTSIGYAGGGAGMGGNATLYGALATEGGGSSGSSNGTGGYLIGQNGIDGTGGGGGGGQNTGGNGGSGIVVIRYKKKPVAIDNNVRKKITLEYKENSYIREFRHSGGTEDQTIYTGDNAFKLPAQAIADILVVGGGGSGSASHGGGGGAGAVIFMKNVTMNGDYTIKVGKGGVCETPVSLNAKGRKGNDTEIFKTNNISNKIVAEGGGGGGQFANANGGSGGSGGGGDAYNIAAGTGGVANAYTPILDGVTGVKYGNNGGNAFGNPGHGGGGGGAGGTGKNALGAYNSGDNEKERAHGGVGIKSATINSVNYDFKTLFGTNVGGIVESDGFLYFGGGGGNGRWSYASSGVGAEGGNGGLGGGGKGGWATSGGSQPLNGAGYPAVNGTGGGGGGGGDNAPPGGNGGSGIVIIRYNKQLFITEGNPITHKTLDIAYTVANPTYTLNFPVPTTTDILERTAGRGILNNSDLILHGTYDINFTASSATIVPKTGQYLPFTAISNLSQNIAFRYHLLNPIKMPAQWTYSSNNANVYHLGNVGIGTTNLSYNLHVNGTIFTSTGGYTQTGLTTWTVMSDRRIKENIVKASYDKCLENVKNIELYNFNFKDNCVNTNDRRQLGFIAQEVQQVYPKAVEVGRMLLNTNETINDVLTLNTTQIDYTLYGAVKYLIEKVEMLEQKLEKKNTITNSSNVITNSSNSS